MKDIGLVLGAGGIAGQAYHAGVLAALEASLDWDPRKADIMVGTSAGSITATLLRSGIPARDLAAWTTRAPLSVEGHLLEELFGKEFPEMEQLKTLQLLRRPSLPGPALVRRALLRPWQPPGAALFLTVLAPGRIDITEYLEPLRAVEPVNWQDRDLWICAVRRRDGRRVVFGQPGSPMPPIHLAVSASCAVPGYFAPVSIDGTSYVDGGVHSPTNAAVVTREGLRMVVLVSPMSGARGMPSDVIGLVRRHSDFRLNMEVRALRAAGVEVVLFEPDSEVQEIMGRDWMSRDRAEAITHAAFASTVARIEAGGVKEVFDRAGHVSPDGSVKPIPTRSA